MSMTKSTIVKTDIVIIGGGIAGLWALNRLRQLGYSVILLESHTLGGGQTLKSQGIIHGGIKYALKGFLSHSSNAIETMPLRWKACLKGEGEIDLRSVQILSPYQFLWSTGELGSNIASFFASKALSSRVKKLSRMDYPTVFQNPSFKGKVYRLEEVVLDTHSLIETLVKPHQETILKIEEDKIHILIHKEDSDLIPYIEIQSNQQTIQLHAKRYVFAAGEGNAKLIRPIPQASAMQTRPLHMVLMKFEGNYPLYAHCLESSANPRITITSYTTSDGKMVWYLGGQLAEEGVNRTSHDQIQAAQQEFKSLFPWLHLNAIEWTSFFINRAEPQQPGGKRPDDPFIQSIGNAFIVWPTKLALSPLLVDECITLLQQQGITPTTSVNLSALEYWPKPKIATPVWDELF